MLLAETPESSLNGFLPPSIVTIAGKCWSFLAEFFFFLGFTMTVAGSYLEYNALEEGTVGETSRDLLSFDA